jgi:hypothetical protein
MARNPASVSALLLVAAAGAQQSTTPSLAFDPAELRTPLQDGIAGGASFKATFRDGFAFYPFVGPDRAKSPPLRWRTESVTMGGAALPVETAPRAEAGSWRMAWQHGTWTEVYDLRPDGVEQSFVLHSRPLAQGDALVRGRIDTELTSPAVAGAHQALVFADADGTPLVRYGEAFAFDALGRRTAAMTSFDGTHITLSVPGVWLAEASFPVTIDPLTTTVFLASSATLGAVSSTDIAHDGGAGTRPLLFAFSRAFSANDHDAYAFVSASDFSNRVLIHARQDPAESDRNVTVCYVSASNKWLIGYQNEYTVGTQRLSTIRTYFHPANLTTLNPGNNWWIPQIFIQAFRNPDLGGTTAGNTSPRAILAYQLDNTNNLTNTDHTDIWVTQIDANTEQFLNGRYAAGTAVGTTWDRENPSVNQVAGTNDGWIVAYQERRTDTVGPWSVQAMRSDANAIRIDSAPIATSASFQAQTPQVAGRNGNYLIAYLQSTSTPFVSTAIRTIPVVWNAGAAAPASVGAPQTVATGVPPSFSVSVQSLAYDARTASHWALAYVSTSLVGLTSRSTPRIVRLGGSGGVTETATLFSSTTENGLLPSVTFNSNLQEFPVVFATTETNDPVYGRILEYPSTAFNTSYGTGCGTNRLTAGQPFAGNKNYAVQASLLPSPVSGILVFSLGMDNLPLDGIGMTSCFLNVNMAQQVLVAGGAGNGAISWPLPLPDVPVVTGDFYFQVFYLAVGANPANLLATRGLLSQVR